MMTSSEKAVMSDSDTQLLRRLTTLNSEKELTAPNCKMHFVKQPMKIAKASKQYMYDSEGYEYLDCSGNLPHVGHCHPSVFHSGQKQMRTLVCAQGFITDVQRDYAKRLLKTFINPVYDTVLMLNSGSEASDLAIRLAKAYTKREHMLVTMPSIHGQLESLKDYNYNNVEQKGYVAPNTVTHIPLCNPFRGKYSVEDNPSKSALEDLDICLKNLQINSTPPAALITEAMHTAAGNVLPPRDWLPSVARRLREANALLIMDEVITGLGRFGTHMWGFEHFNVTPDIVTCGRCMANGQPMACVITRNDIASSLPYIYANSFGGNPVSCAMGQAVLDVIENEKLLSSCAAVSESILSSLRKLVDKYEKLGDIRGMGFSLAMDIVVDKASKKPDSDFAEQLSYRLRNQYRVLVLVNGPFKNCLFINPPMCFTMENAVTLTTHIDKAFNDVMNNKMETIRDIFDLKARLHIPVKFVSDPVSSGKRKADPDVTVSAKINKYDSMD